MCVCVYSSGILPGGSRGGILSRKCVHCWSAANAGNGLRNPDFRLGLNTVCWKEHVMSETITHICNMCEILSMTWAKLIFHKLCTSLFFLQMPEEEAFCVFVRLMQEYRLRELFKPSMAELGLCIYQFEYLLQVTKKGSMSLAVLFLSTRGGEFFVFMENINVSPCCFKFALKFVFLRSNFPSWTSIFDPRVFTHPCTPPPGSSLFSSPSFRCLLPHASLIFSCMR